MSTQFPQGWIYDWRAVDDFVATLRRPLFGVSGAPLRGSGEGKVVLLWKHLERLTGAPLEPHLQTVGDCVSHGFGLAVDILSAVEIDLHGELEEWRAKTATEPLYAASRVEIGGGRISGDGSYGAWAARALTDYGTLLRARYGNFDLRRYSGRKARDWGRSGNGVPDILEPTMREHPVRTVSLVTSYEDARDAIANGYPVPVCSQQGFSDRRDRDGFAKPSGSWAHCMCFIGVDDAHRREGLLCQNSWGPDWITGPRRHHQPEGSFWVDADVANRMLGRNPDSYSLSGFEGYPARDLDYDSIWS